MVDTPDVHGRYEILQLHARGRQFTPDVDLFEIAKLCPGFSGAEIANVVNEAALLTVREGHVEIDQRTLEEAIDRVVAGPASPARPPSCSSSARSPPDRAMTCTPPRSWRAGW